MPTTQIPHHIAIIMDGNRRWARQHKLKMMTGHERVANQVIEELVERCIDHGVAYLTFWAFSTENWKRDEAEVMGLMNIFRQAFSKNAERLHKKGVRLNAIGDLSKFPTDIQQNVHKWIADSRKNDRITVTFALNYGGRDELLRATRQVAAQVLAGEVTVEDMTEDLIASKLDTAGLPDPDLLIRPGGEQRLSGFLPWQMTYTELYFTPILMPDFGAAELDKAIEEYGQRQRRFGA